MVKTLFKSLLLPPFGLLLALLLIALLIKRRPRLGRTLLWIYLGLFYLLSVPFVATHLLLSLEWYPPLEESGDIQSAGAIVVLSAAGYRGGPEYRVADAPEAAADRAGALTLQRLQYAAYLARRTGLPILTTGSSRRFGPERSMAQLMKRTLEEDFRVAVRWTEDQARDTFQNARNSQALLQAEGIETVLLVTHAWHMPRAVFSFETAGLRVIAAPTRFAFPPEPRMADFWPSMGALQASYYGLHEWLGLAWYWLVHRG